MTMIVEVAGHFVEDVILIHFLFEFFIDFKANGSIYWVKSYVNIYIFFQLFFDPYMYSGVVLVMLISNVPRGFKSYSRRIGSVCSFILFFFF